MNIGEFRHWLRQFPQHYRVFLSFEGTDFYEFSNRGWTFIKVASDPDVLGNHRKIYDKEDIEEGENTEEVFLIGL